MSVQYSYVWVSSHDKSSPILFGCCRISIRPKSFPEHQNGVYRFVFFMVVCVFYGSARHIFDGFFRPSPVSPAMRPIFQGRSFREYSSSITGRSFKTKVAGHLMVPVSLNLYVRTKRHHSIWSFPLLTGEIGKYSPETEFDRLKLVVVIIRRISDAHIVSRRWTTFSEKHYHKKNRHYHKKNTPVLSLWALREQVMRNGICHRKPGAGQF
jgi:hypothetical protein